MKRIIFALALASTGLVLIATASCSSDTTAPTPAAADTGTGEHTSPYPDCQTILSACHELDVGDGPIHECHEVAHDAKSNAECAPKKTECLATCKASPGDGGGGGDGGGNGEGGGHGHDE